LSRRQEQPPATDDSGDGGPVLSFKPRRRAARGEDSGPVPLSDLLVPTLSRLGLKTKAQFAQLLGAWSPVVGDMVAAHTSPIAFLRGRLTVETDSPAMGHQLHLQRQTIVDGLNKKLGERVVFDIRFRLAGDKDLSDGSRRGQ
jgi:hypothetical protein